MHLSPWGRARVPSARLRRDLRNATFLIPVSLFAACAADTGDLLKPLGEGPNPSASASVTSTTTESSSEGTGGSTNQATGSGTGNSTAMETATETSSSTASMSVDASMIETDGGGSATGTVATGSATSGSTGTGATGDSGVSGGQSGAQCSPATAAVPSTWPTGGLPLSPANYSSGLANGGYVYPYGDQSVGDGGGTSTICQDSSTLCAAGTTGIQSASTWGAGFGVNLNQVSGSAHAVGTYAVPASAAGISYAVTSLPASQTVYLTIDNAGTDYYAPLTALSGHLPWSSFKTTPWTPATSVVLASAPSTATHVEFQIQAESGSASNFSFCVTALSFQ